MEQEKYNILLADNMCVNNPCKNCGNIIKYKVGNTCVLCRRKSKKRAQKKYRTSHKEDVAKKNKKYEQDNREKVNLRKRKWYNNNREKALAKTHKYRAKKRGNGGSYTADEWLELCVKYGMRCLRCKTTFDISQLTVDHVVPVSKGGTSNIENLQPLCGSCNSVKKDTTIDYRPYYVY